MPVRRAQAGRNPFGLWRLRKRRPPAGVETGEPVDADERLAQQELARRTVDDVHQAVLVGEQDDATTASTPVDLAEHGHLRRVPVHYVVRRELVMPSQRAGIRVERDERIAVKVVSQTTAAVVVGYGIADPPEGQVQLGVVASDLPDACTAGLPRIAGPRFVTRLARTRDGVETPDLTASGGVVCGDQAADAVAGGFNRRRRPCPRRPCL